MHEDLMTKLGKLTWVDPTDIKCFRKWLSSFQDDNNVTEV